MAGFRAEWECKWDEHAAAAAEEAEDWDAGTAARDRVL